MNITDLFERAITAVCKIFFGIVWIVTLMHKIIVKIFALILIFMLWMSVIFVIGMLPAFWQSLVLTSAIIGASITFISILILRIWKTEKFFEIYDNYLEKHSRIRL